MCCAVATVLRLAPLPQCLAADLSDARASPWLRFVAGARSAMEHFPVCSSPATISLGFDWVRFAECNED
jgi:hypothetical protein